MNSDIRILDVETHFRYKQHRSTLKFGGAVKGPPARSGADLARVRRGSGLRPWSP